MKKSKYLPDHKLRVLSHVILHQTVIHIKADGIIVFQQIGLCLVFFFDKELLFYLLRNCINFCVWIRVFFLVFIFLVERLKINSLTVLILILNVLLLL